jgi:hypothetical protein
MSGLFDFLGLGNDNSQNDLSSLSRSYDPGYLAPNEYVDFTGSNGNTAKIGTVPLNNSVGSSWFSGDGMLSGAKGGGLEGIGGIGGIANILAGLGNTWNGFNQQKNARKALNFQKDAFNRTFTNNNKVYNQNMEDVLRARSAQTGQNYDNVIAERRL